MNSLERARVLIVDDEEANISILRRILMKSGCQSISTARTASDALVTFVRDRPDIVLLDLHMPDESGLDLLARLKPLLPEGEFVPVIMLTGDTSLQARQSALATGAHDFITKPFEFTEVLLRINNLLETRWLHLRLREENATLDLRVSERTRDLEEARIEILERLGRAAEFRDDNTGQHAKRVGELAGLLAQACGVDRAEAELIRRAAPLHDIGKIGIPDAILLKPGPLTDAEFAIMRTHAALGAQILSGSRSAVLQRAEQIALQHHERWDGTGYPSGMEGSDISVAARVVSVVDFYDALSSDRPYRKAWPRDKIAAEIQRQRGTQFDPDVADHFLDLVAG